MGGDVTQRAPRTGRRRGGWRRNLLLFALLVVATAVSLRIALAFFAADLFAGAVRRAATGAGLEIVYEGTPTVSWEGFDVRRVVVRMPGGAELLTAESASGLAQLSFRSPYLRLALTLTDSRILLSPQESEATSTLLLPALPAILSGVVLERASVDLGAGRVLVLDAAIDPDIDGGLAIAASRVDYSEPSGERAVEKLAGELRLFTPRAPAGAEKRADAGNDAEVHAGIRMEANITAGAALIGAVLLDLEAHPLSAAGTLLRKAGGSMQADELAIALGRLLRVSGRAQWNGDGVLQSADVVASSDNLKPAFETLVREPFAGIAPALTDASVEGRGQIALRLDAPSRFAADATISLSLAQLRTRAAEAESLEVELPWIGASLSRAPARQGRLRVARLSLLELPWTRVDSALVATAGRLRATAPQQWKLFGGTLHASDLLFEDDASGGPRLSATLRADELDLSGLGDALGIGALAGTFGGNLGRVRLDGDALRAEGALVAHMFGGSVHVSGLRVEQPFSRVPSIGLDVEISDIDLAAATGAIGFGRVTGVLEGRIRDLVIADGQPQSFDADLHTVPRRGVSQTVDVRAIVQLGVLGGGDSSITGALLRVVDRYRYSAMGLRARLHNDVFEIRGVETRAGKDYIVRGSLLPPSVSVVSHSQVVSFSEMLRRVQRIANVEEGGSPDAAPP